MRSHQLFALCFFLGTPSDPAVREVSRFEDTYRSARTLRAAFLETYSENGRAIRTEAGTAYFRRPGKMRWEYESPEPNLYVVDGKWSWFYVPADHTVTRVRAKESSDWRTPFALLAGEMKVSRICRNVELEHSMKALDPRGVLLRCVLRGGDAQTSPKEQLAGVASSEQGNLVLFELNSATGELLRVVVEDPGGLQLEFRFSNWQFDPQLDESKFHFQPTKGVAIVDGNLGVSADKTGR
jgi:outer membrane lipoprotein carrier protein